ncbi:MAG: hypothetical protein ACI8PB_005240, partial [Desulforhopalus sp.]
RKKRYLKNDLSQKTGKIRELSLSNFNILGL